MNGSIIQETLAGYDCSLYLPAQYNAGTERYPVVYLLGESELTQVMTILEKSTTAANTKAAIVVAIKAQSWEKDFSPWKADALSENTKPFSGEAGHFLYILESQIKTFVDKNYRTLSDIEYTYLAGYSLAGLAVLYALHTTHFALSYASISGSLWFPKWLDYAQENTLQQMSEDCPTRIYLSLGKTEGSTANRLMAKVDDCTKKTVALFKEQLATLGQNAGDVFFEYNDGGHMSNVPERTARALSYLLKKE